MKWTEEQLTTLDASIAHWERLASRQAGKQEDEEEPNANYCALCRAFNCQDCPVGQYTGLGSCRGTPYVTAASAWYDDSGLDEFKVEAQAELEFLREVRDSGNKPLAKKR